MIIIAVLPHIVKKFVVLKKAAVTLEKPEKKRYINVRMRVLTMLLLLAIGSKLWADTLPVWLAPLRDAIYEQRLNSAGVKPLYETARAEAEKNCSGTALDLALSRCEYFMGRALQEDKQDEEARVHYNEGMRLAEKAVAAAPSAGAWVSLAENLSQACSLGPWTYTAANGLNVEKFSKNALTYDKRNASAQFMIAARWVYAPAPFHNHRKGIQMMEAIITEGDMEKDNYFDVYSSIGYAYIQQKKFAEARPWLLRSQEIYPTNKYVRELLDKK